MQRNEFLYCIQQYFVDYHSEHWEKKMCKWHEIMKKKIIIKFISCLWLGSTERFLKCHLTNFRCKCCWYWELSNSNTSTKSPYSKPSPDSYPSPIPSDSTTFTAGKNSFAPRKQRNCVTLWLIFALNYLDDRTNSKTTVKTNSNHWSGFTRRN